MDIEDFENRKWVLYGAPCTPLVVDMFASAPSRGFIPLHGISNEVLCLSKGNYMEWLFDKNQVVALAEYLLPTLLTDPWGYYAYCRKAAEKYDTLHVTLLTKDLYLLSDDELSRLTKEYTKAFEEQFAVNEFIEPLSFYFQDHFKDMLLAEGIKEVDINILMSVYGRAKYPNFIKMCLSEYELAHSETEKDTVLKKYPYLSNDYLGPKPLTKAYIEELQKQQTHEPEAHRHIKLPSTAKKLLEVFQLMATLQDVRKAESLMMVSGTFFIAEEYAKRLKIPLNLLLFALWDEILSHTVSLEKLRSRSEHCIIFWGQAGTEMLEGKESLAISDVVRRSLYGNIGKIQEIKGVGASLGKVRGRAVVIMHPEAFSKVKAGDILFTMQTRPEFLPVMQLAAAFVTDEGGMTSHAAIVAREMKKPCIIATKIGTKVVKDGDMVEVDADNGVVRIIKKI